MRVSHDGFDDWQSDVVCDGRPQQVIAELRSGAGKIPMPAAPTVAFNVNAQHDTPHNFSSTQDNRADMQKTSVQVWDTGNQGVAVDSIPPKKRRFFSPLVLGAIALFGLLALGGVGLGGAYIAGLLPGQGTGGNKTPTPPPVSPSPSPSVSPSIEIKAEMVQIPGGTFQMGRDDGDPKSRPSHAVPVETFWMDKTEVTDGEYLAFVTETGHVAPKHWSGGRPLAGTETMPVRHVSLEDAEAFAKWRSKRDGLKYRLPTESEWEYAARNGQKANLYPWGNEWNAADTVMGVADAEPSKVGSKPQGKNDWGIVDLIGNVWELTSSELTPYPGADVVDVKKPPGKRIVVRGGSAYEDPAKVKIDSSFRVDVAATQKEKNVGFRLVRSE